MDYTDYRDRRLKEDPELRAEYRKQYETILEISNDPEERSLALRRLAHLGALLPRQE